MTSKTVRWCKHCGRGQPAEAAPAELAEGYRINDAANREIAAEGGATMRPLPMTTPDDPFKDLSGEHRADNKHTTSAEFERGVLSRADWTDALHATYFALFGKQAPESMKPCDISHAIVDWKRAAAPALEGQREAPTDVSDAHIFKLACKLVDTADRQAGTFWLPTLSELCKAVIAQHEHLRALTREPRPTVSGSTGAAKDGDAT